MAADDCTRLSKAESSASESTNLFCRWHGCIEKKCFPTNEEFTKHVEEVHCHRKNGLTHPTVPNGLSKDHVCLWEGCKFFLRHIRTHTKGRPHPCIMNGCSSAFWTVGALEKHLQLHFSEGATTSYRKGGAGCAGEGRQGTSSSSKQKLKKAKGKDAPKKWFPECDSESLCVCVELAGWALC